MLPRWDKQVGRFGRMNLRFYFGIFCFNEPRQGVDGAKRFLMNPAKVPTRGIGMLTIITNPAVVLYRIKMTAGLNKWNCDFYEPRQSVDGAKRFLTNPAIVMAGLMT